MLTHTRQEVLAYQHEVYCHGLNVPRPVPSWAWPVILFPSSYIYVFIPGFRKSLS